MTDEELMTRYGKEDDPQAFSMLYSKHSSIVYGFITKKTFNKTNADEIFQNVFMKLHSSRHQYDPKFPFTAWLYTIARTTMTDYFRKIQSAGSIQENYRDFLISDDLNKNQDREIILDGLKEQERDLLEKRYREDWSFAEIASHLNISEAGVRQKISRVIRQLRGKYV